jgi:hypothetical protein
MTCHNYDYKKVLIKKELKKVSACLCGLKFAYMFLSVFYFEVKKLGGEDGNISFNS